MDGSSELGVEGQVPGGGVGRVDQDKKSPGSWRYNLCVWRVICPEQGSEPEGSGQSHKTAVSARLPNRPCNQDACVRAVQ